MGDMLKVLGQAAPAATTDTEFYLVPDLAMTTVSSLVICNRSALAATFRVRVAVADATIANEQYLFYDAAIAANTTFSVVLGLTLSETDKVYVYASSTGLSFNMFGVETSA
jgi:hypothetical protein